MTKRKSWQSKLTKADKEHAREWLVPNDGLYSKALTLERAKEAKANGCSECIHIVAKLEGE